MKTRIKAHDGLFNVQGDIFSENGFELLILLLNSICKIRKMVEVLQ